MNIQDLQTILNLVLTSGIVGQFIFFKSKQRKSVSEADMSEVAVKAQEFDLEKTRFDHVKKELEDNYAQLEELQKIINELRKKLNVQSQNIFDLEQSLIIANSFKCTKLDCNLRTPPRCSKEEVTINQI